MSKNVGTAKGVQKNPNMPKPPLTDRFKIRELF